MKVPTPVKPTRLISVRTRTRNMNTKSQFTKGFNVKITLTCIKQVGSALCKFQWSFHPTVYANSLRQHRLSRQHNFSFPGDTIELQCTVLHWGEGDPDLRFHLFDEDGTILRDEVTLDKRDKSLYLTTKLDRYHHGKRFGKPKNQNYSRARFVYISSLFYPSYNRLLL